MCIPPGAPDVYRDAQAHTQASSAMSGAGATNNNSYNRKWKDTNGPGKLLRWRSTGATIGFSCQGMASPSGEGAGMDASCADEPIPQESHKLGAPDHGSLAKLHVLHIKNNEMTRVVVRVVVAFEKEKSIFLIRKQQLPEQLPASFLQFPSRNGTSA